jgi:peptidoglycan hydrolase CwlO-like protein
MKDILKITSFLFLLVVVFMLPRPFLSAQENSAETCQIENIEAYCQARGASSCRELLERCERYFMEESARIEKDISKTEREKQTLQNKIYTLRNQIKNLEYQIYQSNLIIKDLGLQIEDTKTSIKKTSLKIERGRERLAAILRTIYEEDQRSLVEILLSEGISDFFENLVALEALDKKNQELLKNIKALKVYLEKQKQSLDEEKGEMEQLVYVQTLQKQQSEELKGEKEYYLKLTEEEYQRQLKEKKEITEQVAEIRHRLFELIGVPEGGIEFGKAVEIAQYVEKVTGVRAAFLLSILAQESMRYGKIGENVGQCYLRNTETGNGVYIRTGKKAIRTMNPSRDVPHFLEIIEEINREKGLARTYSSTPVSCWIPAYYQGKPYGWGGAMGPAQFIPSTWARYKEEISGVIGRIADPWEIKDSFLAAGIFLRDLGAATNEFKAAMRYFSGSSWTWWEEKNYGQPVMDRATKYQEEINLLEQSK